ncbi:MAG: TIGR03617 family F420-dependent LLM class oxidoreductase, partial [Myxococcota bacterium]
MKVDAGLFGGLTDIPRRARELEAMGYDGAMTAETANDPFFPLALAAEHTERIELMTSIAVAFSRSPMTLANIGHDLNAFSEGRFILGLGSQIRPHITKRFSMPWSQPAKRMREFILAMRAIWDNWYDGTKLDFRGEFYSHTLMTPMFTPTDRRFGAPRVYLAAVGPLMTEVAGETADGMIAHAFTTNRYVREVTMPAIERGLAKSGRSRADFSITCPAFVVTGSNDETTERSQAAVRKQISFYASTPAYRPVLDMHGWGELQPELTILSKRGEWDEMATRITDEMLDEFAIIAPPDRVVPALTERYGDIFDRV